MLYESRTFIIPQSLQPRDSDISVELGSSTIPRAKASYSSAAERKENNLIGYTLYLASSLMRVCRLDYELRIHQLKKLLILLLGPGHKFLWGSVVVIFSD
jgi:hypothetical protein